MLIGVLILLAWSLTGTVWAGEQPGPNPQELRNNWVGFYALTITFLAYFIAMTEDLHHMSKAKPMVLGSVLIWLVIFIYHTYMGGVGHDVAVIFQTNLTAYAELFLFITVSMTFLNAMTERHLFDVLRIKLERLELSYRQLFWITGVIAFLLSLVISSLTVGLLMGYIIINIGKSNQKFVGLAGLNAVVAANAGGTMSPLGGISTFFVWQQNALSFWEFFELTLPCIVNFFVPALFMSFAVEKGSPDASDDVISLKRGSRRIIAIFVITFTFTIATNVYLEMPAILGMMFGLALLQFFAYFLTATETKGCSDNQKGLDVFKCIAGVDWDTLLFFYGAMMIVGALSYIGYLDQLAAWLFHTISPTLANILIGLSSSSIDNGTLMFAVLNMHPAFPKVQWLLLTLTLGVGGSLLAIGSAPALHVLGLMKGNFKAGEGYTFSMHLRWMPVILLGFFASILVLYLQYEGQF
jgi:Na+/H+ antiporter NhaD/arsenite permease-like protein